MTRTIVLLTNDYPYGRGEPFIDNELPYAIRCGARLFVLPSVPQTEADCRPLPAGVRLMTPPRGSRGARAAAYGRAVYNRDFWREMARLRREKKLCAATVRAAAAFIAHSDRIIRAVRSQLPVAQNILFYAYWMHTPVYAALRLRAHYPGARVVTRCHGYDLYESRGVMGYIPCRRRIYSETDWIYATSEDGMRYLSLVRPHAPYALHRLGTRDSGTAPAPVPRTALRVVSCAWAVPLKRLHLIVQTLARLDFPVEWTHFGDGVTLGAIKEQAALLPEHITCRFAGRTPNEDILSHYRNCPVDILVSVSETEGIPVSMMEAISFGIPVAATHVGGVGEVVQPGVSGWLLRADHAVADLCEALRLLWVLPAAQVGELRSAARRFWESAFRADINYPVFWDRLMDIN